MITQCPVCKKQHSLSVTQLRASNAVIYCDQCELEFDPLELLKEQSFPENKQSKDLLPNPHETRKYSAFWALGFSLCIALIAFQLYFFEANSLSQNSALRPWLEKICTQFKCHLATYKNLDDFSVVHGSFELSSDKAHYVFKTAFINQSAFKQHLPAIKLTLQNFTGSNFAERIFLPQEYLNQNLDVLNPDMSVEISLKIAIPSKEIGGYRFELI